MAGALRNTASAAELTSHYAGGTDHAFDIVGLKTVARVAMAGSIGAGYDVAADYWMKPKVAVVVVVAAAAAAVVVPVEDTAKIGTETVFLAENIAAELRVGVDSAR